MLKNLWAVIMVVLFCQLFTGAAFAQNARLNGIVTEYSTSEALQGANIVLTNLDNPEVFLGSSSDADGIYFIQRITPGEYKMVVSFLGYISYEDTLMFAPNDSKSISVSLRIDEVNLGEVIVESNSGAARIERGVQRITPVEMSRVPAPMIGGDLVSYLQVLPGVVSLGSRGGQVFVRGGTPSENMVLVDGAMIYKPFHILSFFSPFPDNLVASADFYPGGFGAKYSGRVSSVLDIEMKHGDRLRYGGSASISPFLGDVMVQGPIRNGELSFIVAAKKSIIEETSGSFMNEVQPLQFESQFVKLSKIQDDSQCSGMLLRTYDRGKIDFESDERIEWQNLVVSAKCEAINENFYSYLSSSISRLDNASINTDRTYTSDITQFNTNLNLAAFKGDIRMDFGVYWKVEWLNYDLAGRVSGLDKNSDDPLSKGGHIQFTIPIGENMNMETGLAVASYRPYPWSFEPRLRISWSPFGEDKGELSGALGIYRQMIVGFSDQRDATGVFVTWTQTPWPNEQPEARHALLGWQQTIGAFSYSAEAFYKALYDTPITTWSAVARFSTDLSLADGEIYGTDVRMEYNKRGFYGMLNYGYTNTTYTAAQDNFGYWFGDPVVSFNPPHDRRHQVNALLSKKFGKITSSARWQYGSGVPYTRPLGFDEIIWFDQGFPDVTNQSGTTRVLIDKPFTGRFPSYHSFDVSLERVFEISGNTRFTTKLGALNIYDRSNIFYYDLYNQNRVDQLPITAYISFKIEV
jgi:hypothetical protein